MNKRLILETLIQSFIGKPYIWGGDTPMQGFDCSGFVLELLKSVGLFPSKIDTTAQGLAAYFKAIPAKSIRPAFGDLVFFGEDFEKITHVGFALNDDLFVEAGGGNSSCVDVASAITHKAYIRIRPLMSRKDLVGLASPPYKFEANA